MTTYDPAEQAVIPTIRAAATAMVERTSLREIARQIGMSPSGLDKFLNGTEPHRKIRRRLETWYTRVSAQVVGRQNVLSPESAAAAVRVLAVLYAPARRGAFVEALVEQMDDVLPEDPAWREDFRNYDAYMRAGGL
jgi:predicted transcriptional regulator